MSWTKRTLRGTVVYARARPDGSLEVDPEGRVEVKYKLDDGARVYRASARNLADAAGDGAAPTTPARSPAAARTEAVIVYTDGACTGNPGPMGIGVVILRGRERQELSEYLGQGTNNIAELTAIERALDALDGADAARPVLVHVDSAYAIGVASGAFKAKKNLELVARLRDKARRFPHLRFVKVAGHAGVAENERCDQLATQAIARGARAG
jgi:ribonuclease HI